MRSVKSRLGLLGLMLVLLAGADVARAETVTISPAGSMTATADRTITFGPDPPSAFTCGWTMTRTVTTSSVIVTPDGSAVPIGTTTTSTSFSCGAGAALAFSLLPWGKALKLIRRGGRLVTLFRSVAARFGFRLFGGLASCTYQGDFDMELSSDGRTLITDPSMASLPLVSGGGLCPNPMTFEGTMNLIPAQTVTIR